MNLRAVPFVLGAGLATLAVGVIPTAIIGIGTGLLGG